jgi:hypothetical protein
MQSAPRRWAITLSVLASAALGACAPLPSEPVVSGPVFEREASPSQVLTRELVWVTTRGTLRVTAARMCKRDDQESTSGACVQLSTSDRRELDRFFGADNFRKRWDDYVPCPAEMDAEPEAFKVTFSDGQSIAKTLDWQRGSPSGRGCDRATRNALSGIGDDLVKRYFR